MDIEFEDVFMDYILKNF